MKTNFYADATRLQAARIGDLNRQISKASGWRRSMLQTQRSEAFKSLNRFRAQYYTASIQAAEQAIASGAQVVTNAGFVLGAGNWKSC